VDPGRLVFSRRVSREEYLSRLATADIFLDTLPYNAGTTANDALRAGVPIVSCAGQGFAARMAGSLLHAVGMPGLVTASLEEYERLALALAQDPGRLQSTREALLRQRADSALFDTAAFVQGVEAAYARMWARCASGERPEAFSLSASDLR
jgi:predicted O-linked N-acetylglucosamine transferase (SPINDLY family)